MNIFYDAYNLVLALAHLRRRQAYPARWSVFADYVRIRCKNRWLQWRQKKCLKEKFLGFEAEFFDYATFTYLFEEIFVQGTYEFLARNRQPVIVDAGSNIGLSVLFLKWLYPESHILAFEPDPATFALLKKNIEANHLENVKLYNLALAKGSGEADFRSHQAGSLVASLLQERAVGEIQRVPTQSLSWFLKEPIDFMKMDIEGAESDCLLEASNQGLLSGIHEMVIECHHNLPGRKTILSELLPVLEANGFGYQIRSTTQSPGEKSFAQDVILHVFHQDDSTAGEGV